MRPLTMQHRSTKPCAGFKPSLRTRLHLRCRGHLGIPRTCQFDIQSHCGLIVRHRSDRLTDAPPREGRIPMYYQVISQCAQALKNLETWLDKAEQHADAKKFDVDALMTSRLAPDMKDFVYQVQSACDYVK